MAATPTNAASSAVRHRVRARRPLAGERVPDIPHRPDDVAELGPQTADVHVHDVAAGVEREAPYFRQQLRAAAHVPGVADEMTEEQELPLREVHFTLQALSPALHDVELHATSVEVGVHRVFGLR